MEAELDELRGRCQALEIMVAGFMAREVENVGYAVGRSAADVLRERESEQFGSLQLLKRGIDERSEAAWSAMTEALKRLYHNAAARLLAAKD